MELAAISQRVDEVALSIRAHDDGASKYAAAPPSSVMNSRRIPPARAHLPLQNVRLSSDAGNPLSESRNWQADGDGWVGAG
jgi:hypothetical protein